MKRILLTSAFILANGLFANNVIMENKTINDVEKEKPQVLEFENVLKKLQEKKNNELNMPPLPPLEFGGVGDIQGVEFNVMGIVNIGSNKYCYLLIESNKIIKATVGMTIKNKKIEEIADYGIHVSDKSKNSMYIPIMTNQVLESDIAFSNRDSKKNNLN